MNTTRIYLVRHGATQLTAEDRFSGSTGVDFRDAVHARLMLFNDTSHYADKPREAKQSLSKWWDERPYCGTINWTSWRFGIQHFIAVECPDEHRQGRSSEAPRAPPE